MPFFKNNNNIEIVGFACYDYVLIYQVSPSLIELYKFQRPSYFKEFHIANISFGLGYIPRAKDIIDMNKVQNQQLNVIASENCIDSKGQDCGTEALSDKNPIGDGTYWNDFILKKQYKNISY